MKKIFYFIAFFAMVSAASSCTDNLAPQTNESSERYITATFAASPTKTTLGDDLTPRWAAGDEIWVSDGANSGKVTLTAGDIAEGASRCSFLLPEGVVDSPIYAVYPYNAAKGEINNKKQIVIIIPETQDGSFKSANICAASTDGNTLSFYNATAIFRINAGQTGVKSVTITSADASLSGEVGASFNTDGVYLEENGENGGTVKVSSETALETYYIAAAAFPEQTPFRLDFEFAKSEMQVAYKSKSSASLAVNNFYTIDITGYTFSYPEFVDLGLSSGLKWAFKNLGASAPQEAGNYYAWGSTDVVYSSLSGNTFTFNDSKPSSDAYANVSWDKSKGWAWENCPWTNGTYSDTNWKVFTKYTTSSNYCYGDSPDSKDVLECDDDAAYQIDNSWEMPTKADFNELCGGCYLVWCDGSTKQYNGTTVPGYVVFKNKGSEAGTLAYGNTECNSNYCLGTSESPTTDVHIFLPAAGYGSGSELTEASSHGAYWSTEFYKDGCCWGYHLYFGDSEFDTSHYKDRRYGMPIRPVKGFYSPSAEPLIPLG